MPIKISNSTKYGTNYDHLPNAQQSPQKTKMKRQIAVLLKDSLYLKSLKKRVNP